MQFIAMLIIPIFIFTETLFLADVFNPTPDVAQIQAGCAKHKGVSSVANAALAGRPVIVCKDGKVWFK